MPRSYSSYRFSCFIYPKSFRNISLLYFIVFIVRISRKCIKPALWDKQQFFLVFYSRDIKNNASASFLYCLFWYWKMACVDIPPPLLLFLSCASICFIYPTILQFYVLWQLTSRENLMRSALILQLLQRHTHIHTYRYIDKYNTFVVWANKSEIRRLQRVALFHRQQHEIT